MHSAGVTPASLHQRWQFGVEIDGFPAGNWLKAELPKIQFDEVEHNPGGSISPQKVAGRAKYNDVKLSKSSPQEKIEHSVLAWIKKCVSAAQGTGGVPADYLKDIDVVQYDRTGKETKRWRLFSAFIKEADWGELDGSSSENVEESLTICYNYFDIV